MTQKILSGILLDEQAELSLNDLCQICLSSSEYIIELVEEGVLEPAGVQQAQWRFSANSLQRARTAARLQRDLEINLAGVALALDLLDEIETLRAQLCRSNNE
jgi:chaperone modulatory protein CbpM